MARKQAKRESAAGSNSRTDDQTRDEDIVMAGTSNQESQYKSVTAQTPSSNPAGQLNSPDSMATQDSDSGLELLGRGVKALVTAVQDLRRLGVEDLNLPLPKICVVGDQSTGKSSLIEGISGIKVPRNSGACTRCPLEINLTESEADSPWRCTVYLQKRYIYEGQLGLHSSGKLGRSREGATRHRPFGPWVPQDTEEFLFLSTTKKSDIPYALHCAQLATLNPRLPFEGFIPGRSKIEDKFDVKFSPNIVRLDISAPDVPNLSFFDLPGVINEAEIPEEQYLVDLVHNLVKDYIKTDNCLNLLARTMTDDAANSTAAKLIQSLNAQGRTIGVLTKPDRVQSGESMHQWTEILDGKKYRLGFGYYVVKNNPDPQVDHQMAREEEEHFFNGEPWATTLSTHRDHFGVYNLQKALSHRLTAQIRASLPKITEQVHDKIADIVARLEQLPEPPKGNSLLRISEKINELGENVRKHIDGGLQDYPFQKEWHSTALHFYRTIAFSYPRLHLGTPSTASSTSSQASGSMPYRLGSTPTPQARHSAIISIDSDDDDDMRAIPQSQSKRKVTSTKVNEGSPTKRSRLDNIPKFVPRTNHGLDHPQNTNISRPAPFAQRFTLPEIRDMLRDAHIGLPNQIDPKATERMIKQALIFWDRPLDDFLHTTHESYLAVIKQSASVAFLQWNGTGLYTSVHEICESFFNKIFQKQTDTVRYLLQVERHKALTLNYDALQVATERAATILENTRRSGRAAAYLSKQDPSWDENLTDQQKADKVAKVSDAQLGPDPWSQEVRAMSVVKGYYDCAFPRFVDVVCQNFHAGLFAQCRNELTDVIKEKIGLDEPDAEQRCTMLLAVDPEDERLRISLLGEKKTLDTASDWLKSVTTEDA